MIPHAQGAKGYGAHSIALMSHVHSSLSAILYINDTDLLHLNMDGNKTIFKTHAALQCAIKNWGKLLIVTGGTLKQKECFFHLINFQWTWQGGWQYIGHHEDEIAAVFVLLPNGLTAPIQHQAVDDAQKTLGIITCPSGNSTGSLMQMKEKNKKWLDALTSGRLHHRMTWFSKDCQLWPSVKYGLCCSMATLSGLESVLLLLYRTMLPLGRIIWMASKGIRKLDQGFYGAGLPHPGVEGIVEQSNKLLMHYGCCTALGTKLQTSLGLLLVELVMSFQPLQLLYADYENRVTTSWLKQVWDKLDRFKFAVMVHNLHSVFPQEGDDWLMARPITIGYRSNDLQTLNRVRKHQQVLFLSDILRAGGESLDKCYLQKRRETERWSMMKFPWEIVT
jgi:hypothetical protein